MSLQDEKKWPEQVVRVCSGAVRLEKCECGPAEERGGGQSCFGTVQGNFAKCECTLSYLSWEETLLLSYPTKSPPKLPWQLLDNFLYFTALLLLLLLSQRCVGNTLQWLANLSSGFYDQKLKSHSAWECQGVLTRSCWDHWKHFHRPDVRQQVELVGLVSEG